MKWNHKEPVGTVLFRRFAWLPVKTDVDDRTTVWLDSYWTVRTDRYDVDCPWPRPQNNIECMSTDWHYYFSEEEPAMAFAEAVRKIPKPMTIREINRKWKEIKNQTRNDLKSASDDTDVAMEKLAETIGTIK